MAGKGAVGIIATEDGGVGWGQDRLPSPLTSVRDVSCASPSACVAVGDVKQGSGVLTGVTLQSNDGGQSWGSTTTVPGVAVMLGVACASTLQCVAVGYSPSDRATAVSTGDGGATWQAAHVPLGAGELDAVACATSNVCTAVGSASSGGVVLGSTDGGGTWVVESAPRTADAYDGVSCASPSSCVVTGNDTLADGRGTALVTATTDGGATWTGTVRFARGTVLRSIDCASVSWCVAVGLRVPGATSQTVGAIWTSDDGGLTWTLTSPPGKLLALNAVSCASTAACEVVGETLGNKESAYGQTGAALGTTNGGTHWSGQSLPFGLDDFAGVSCATSLVCVTVGNDLERGGAFIAYTTTGGQSGGIEEAPASIVALRAVTCPTPTVCVAVGDAAVRRGAKGGPGAAVIRSTDSGATWRVVFEDRRLSGAGAVSCRSALVCDVVTSPGRFAPDLGDPASRLLRTADGGTTWSHVAVPRAFTSIGGITCTSTRGCLLYGSTAAGPRRPRAAVAVTADGGSTWSSPLVLAAGRSVSTAACASARRCTAVVVTRRGTTTLMRTLDGGASWRPFGSLPRADAIDALSCGTPLRCTALLSEHGGPVLQSIRSEDGFASFAASRMPGIVRPSLSCSAAGVCLAVGNAEGNGESAILKFAP